MSSQQTHPGNPSIRNAIPLFLLVLLTALALVHCGGSVGSDAPTGNIAFSVAWERGDGSSEAFVPLDLTDCEDVNWVEAVVFDTEGNFLGSGGPWACEAGQGLLQAIPAGRDVWVAVAGLWEEGRVRYRGQSEPFYLPPGATVDSGVIAAGSFVPVQTAPIVEEPIGIHLLELQWNAVVGAQSYLVSITDNLETPGAVQIIQTTALYLQPDPFTLDEEIDYYWFVQARDATGFLSEPSSGFPPFQVLRNLLYVEITQPPWDEFQQYIGFPVLFSATVWGPDETIYTQDQLTTIRWSSDQDGPFGNQLEFEYDELSQNDHLITLTVEARNGLEGSADRFISITP